MEKKKIIYHGCCFIGISLFCVFLYVFIETDSDFAFAVLVMLPLLFMLLAILKDREKEKNNPLNLKKIKEALSYAEDKRRGTKDEFIREKGEIMYNHFLKKGYIHELLFDCPAFQHVPLVWEITLLGRDVKNRLLNE